MAEVLKIHKEIGLASLATLSAKAGYTWQKELSRIINERKTFQELEPKVEEEPKAAESKAAEPKATPKKVAPKKTTKAVKKP